MEIYGVKLIGVNAYAAEKLLFTLVFMLGFALLRSALGALVQLVFSRYQQVRLRFWTRRGIDLATTIILIVGLLSIWFDNPNNLATGVGLASAGLAFVLQQVITSLAGYLAILRAKRSTSAIAFRWGGVRGDVISLGFIQTTIMEMGRPPLVQGGDPAIWISGRQFTGRIVTVTNSKIFAEPVYNYSRDFPVIWEEMLIPVTYGCDRVRAEQILVDAAKHHTRALVDTADTAIQAMMHRFTMYEADLEPRVFYRITDNWLELGLRFLSPTHGARALKDAMSRDILRDFDRAGIGIASATYDIVGFPSLHLGTPTSVNGVESRG